MDDSNGNDICRVCRSEGLPDRPLFHPCICTGSIKWIHQECLLQWMRYSRKEYCELCSHRFSFTPIYSPDMPRRLPLRDVAGGLLSSLINAVRCWLHYSLVAFAWLGIVPLTACRTYRCLFSGSIESIITLPLEILKVQNIPSDVFHGCFVITCTLFAFMGMLWLKEQIIHGGGPEWLERDQPQQQVPPEQPPQENQQNPHMREVAIQAHVEGDRSSTSNNNNNSDDNDNENGNDNDNDNDTDCNPFLCDDGDKEDDDSYENTYDSDDNDSFGRNNNSGNVNNSSSSSNHNSIAIDNYESINEEDINIQLEQAAEVFQDPLEEDQANERIERNRLLPAVDFDPIEADLMGEDGQEEGNWNPIEWDRGVEELTWGRLLGLDGSLVFLEYVLWAVSLNILIIIVFAFCPYHFGNLVIKGMGLREKAAETHFEGLLTTLCGYCIIGFCLVVLHSVASFLQCQESRRVLGLCYIIVKVSFLSVVEIGVFPVICGWWLDICSLALFDATLKDRETSFKLAPGTSMFIHWLVGIIYVYYFASFVLLLREVLRPGVLWFFINLNGPDFRPIQDLIHFPVIHHIQQLLVSSVLFGTAVLLMLWLPVKILRTVWPSFLPYTVMLQTEAQVNELSLELLLLQIILPSLLEQSQSRAWMKNLIRVWCKSVSWLLGLRSYLLGDETVENTSTGRVGLGENAEGLAGVRVNQALLAQEHPLGSKPYQRPSWFYARLFGLLIALLISLVVASLIALTVPVWIGRKIMAFWLVGASVPSPYVSVLTKSATGDIPLRIHELYTAACGTYLCWITARAVSLLRSWLPQGRAAILEKMKQWCVLGVKSFVAFSILLGLIPLLFGILLELVIVVPLRVPLEQTPVFFIWQDWALGVLYTKIACAIIIMGPNWSMQRAIERVYRDGIRNMDLVFIFCDIAMPVVTSFGLALAVPYAIAHGVIPLLITNLQLQNLIVRRLYPGLLVAAGVVVLIIFQIRQFKKLYERIKDDKYLVGRRLVNYDHRDLEKSETSAE